MNTKSVFDYGTSCLIVAMAPRAFLSFLLAIIIVLAFNFESLMTVSNPRPELAPVTMMTFSLTLFEYYTFFME